MPVVVDPTYGPKPSMQLLGGSPSSLAQPSTPFLPGGRSITLVEGTARTISFYSIYRAQPWVGIACRRMSEAIARLPLHLFEYLDPAGDARQRDRQHEAARLVARPRPRQRAVHLLWDLALSTYVQGNWVGWKDRALTVGGPQIAGRPPERLWTLDWRLLLPHFAEGIGSRVIGWTWMGAGIPGLDRGAFIDIHDTVHVAFSAPGGGEVGVSPLEQIATTVRSEDALQRLAEASSRNGTRFGVAAILDPKVKADKPLRDGVREELEDAHGGVDQAFRPAVLGGGITDLKPIGGQTAVEAELLGQRRFNREEACGIVGLPMALAGVLDGANYSAIKEIHRILYVTNLGGPLALLEGALQAQLLDAEPAWDADDRFYAFNLGEVLKGDPKERWETYRIALECGGLTLNDVRRMENLPPYEDERADEPLISSNNVRPLRDVGNGDPGKITLNAVPDDQAQALVGGIVGAHVRRAFERAARGAGAGVVPIDALDADRVERELGEDLEAIGLNGSSGAIAGAIAAELASSVAPAQSIDDVRDLERAHPLTTPGEDA